METIASTGGPPEATQASERITLPPAQPAAPTAAPRRARKIPPRRSKVVIRRVAPWSVLKFSLLFYFCLMLVVMFALMILYWILGLTGVLDSLGRILQNAGFGPQHGRGTFGFDSKWIFERLFMIGLAGVVTWSLVNVLVAYLYNLVSDVVGGISVTLTEKR